MNDHLSESEINLKALLNLDKSTLAALYRKNNLRATLDLLGTFLACFLMFVLLGSTPNIFSYVVSFLVIAALQHRLQMLQHEAIHYGLFSNRQLNEMCGAFCGYLIGLTMAYRKHHLDHHYHLGIKGDPDLEYYLKYPNRARVFFSDIVKDLSGFLAFQKFFSLTFSLQKDASYIPQPPKKLELIYLFLVQVALFGAIAYFSHWYYYFLFWILPLATAAKLITHLRTLAEHVKTEISSDQILNRLRTFRSNRFERFFFAPLNFNYHAVHHLYPGIPYYNLPKAHFILSQMEPYLKYIDVQGSYFGALTQKVWTRQQVS